MALGTLTLVGDSGAARQSPPRVGDLLLEQWSYTNADSTRSDDVVTCRYINRITHVRGINSDNWGATAPYTIDNTVLPPTVTLAGVVTGQSGQVEIYGY